MLKTGTRRRSGALMQSPLLSVGVISSPVHPIRVTIFVRAALDTVFAVYLLSVRPDTIELLATVFLRFVLLDGLLAIVLALLVLRAGWRPGIAAVAAFDGGVRIAAGIGLWLSPGIEFPVTLLLYIGVLATLAFIAGIVDLGESRRLRMQIGRNPLSIGLLLAGVATIVLAVVAFVGVPTPASTRTWLAITAVLQTATLLLDFVDRSQQRYQKVPE